MPVTPELEEEVGHAVGRALVDAAVVVEGRRRDDVDAAGGSIEHRGLLGSEVWRDFCRNAGCGATAEAPLALVAL